VVIVNPAGLDEQLDAVAEEEMPGFGIRRLVRRNDRAVDAVLIGGRIASEAGRKSDALGKEQGYGRVLRALA
jgi:hypothetical protein